MQEDEQKFRKLRIYNFIVGIVLLGQGILMLILSNDFKLPVTTSYLKFDVVTKTISTVPKQIYELRIGPLVALFLLISGVSLLLVSTVLYRWYVRNLKQHINYARWVEYSLSSSIMIVVIAMLCGMYDLSSLILIFFLNAAMIFFGWTMELHNQTTTKTNWTAYIFGCICGIVPWIVIYLYFAGAVSSVGDIIPKFVYGILISIFIFFDIFALNMFLQYKKNGPWKSYLYGEAVYIFLSFAAKSALAWQVFSGTLRPH